MMASEDEHRQAADARLPLTIAISLLVLLFAGIAFQGYLIPAPVNIEPGKFVIPPYPQLGRSGDIKDLEITWASPETKAKWSVSSSSLPGIWLNGEEPIAENIRFDGMPHFRIYHARLKNITSGIPLRYRVSKDDQVVFESLLPAPPAESQPYRFAVLGDVAAGTRGQRELARRLYQDSPQMVLIAGDITYQHGRLSEYLRRFFPVFNAASETENGVPLMRSSLFVTAPGNHDTAYGARGDARNLDMYSDGLAYYTVWKQPLNGPFRGISARDKTDKAAANYPVARGSKSRKEAFYAAAGNSYPGMSMFSFDYGNSHWTVIDGNRYVDWSKPTLRSWVENDISRSPKKWRFVLYHQPSFNSDSHHGDEQHMRALADIFERSGVALVFSGHVHNYQRTRPLRFRIEPTRQGRPQNIIDGTFTFDTSFDGQKQTKANAPIYIITGCGGAELNGAPLAAHPEEWEPFTQKFAAKYSYTQCDMNNERLSIKQIAADGEVLDQFEITR